MIESAVTAAPGNNSPRAMSPNKTARMSRAPNASTGARRRSVTGMKTPAAVSIPIASHIWSLFMNAARTENKTSRAANRAHHAVDGDPVAGLHPLGQRRVRRPLRARGRDRGRPYRRIGRQPRLVVRQVAFGGHRSTVTALRRPCLIPQA